MTRDDPNVQRVELVAGALGDLRERLMLVGGCSVGLLFDTATAPPPRVTYDVDLVAEVAALREYHALEKEFAERGFVRDRSPDAPICRWIVDSVKVDLMPTSESVLGFSNVWYPEAIRSTSRYVLPSGTVINLISPPVFIATKFEAFDTRGKSDMLASHDFEDIINVVEGRSTLQADIQAASQPVRRYIVRRIADLVADRHFRDTLPGLVSPDELHAERVSNVLARLSDIATL